MRSALPNIPIGPRLREYRIRRDWPAIVGEAVAARSAPVRLMGRTLYVTVSSSAWMTELSFHRPLMIERIREHLGEDVLDEIILRPGPIERQRPHTRQRPSAAPGREARLPRDLVERACAAIEDEGLRELVRRVMNKSPRR